MANSPARAVIDVGSVIADTYKIEALIGRGGMGAVFLASHNRLPGKKVAIKLLHAELVDDEVQARFKREAQIASKLGHPNIVEVHDFNVMADGTPYLVLDYLEGETLAQRLRAGPLPHDQAISIVRQIGGALAAAHREGIVHRDLKPQNIFLVPTEVGDAVIEVAKVLDFGISKWRGSETVKTQESALLGTPQYMAPEQATGQHQAIDERTDVFALGAIVYEMMCGRPAFTGASIPEVVFKVVYEQPPGMPDTVPLAIAGAVKKAMSKLSDERFATVGAFVEAMTGQPLTQPRGGRPSLPPIADVGAAAGTGRRGNTGKEAFDHTVGSGDHGANPVASPISASGVPRDASTAPAIGEIGSAATVDSQSRPVGKLGTSPTTVPITGGAPTTVVRRPAGLIAGLAIACIAATAGVMYVAMRGDRADESPTARQLAQVTTLPPVPSDARPMAAVTRDAARPEPSSPPIATSALPAKKLKPQGPDRLDPRLRDPKAKDPKVPSRPSDDRGASGPAAGDGPDLADQRDDAAVAKQQLAQAEAALAAHDYERAERLANTVSNSSANPQQTAHARAIHAIVACLARNDAETAQSDLRSLRRHQALRKRVLRICQRHGQLEGIP